MHEYPYSYHIAFSHASSTLIQNSYHSYWMQRIAEYGGQYHSSHCIGDNKECPFQQNHLFAFEFMVHVWNPDTKSRQSLNLEDNAIVTEKGVEALYPRNDKIIIIH